MDSALPFKPSGPTFANLPSRPPPFPTNHQKRPQGVLDAVRNGCKLSRALVFEMDWLDFANKASGAKGQRGGEDRIDMVLISGTFPIPSLTDFSSDVILHILYIGFIFVSAFVLVLNFHHSPLTAHHLCLYPYSITTIAAQN